ncbi:deubiquitinase DESI2-like [Watersipora subatra]|uniref:deubiquitinase DESI2-like n=1 Tax=Watersipora subatra TaxID=2589382 RepID=UPI00355C6823
MTTPVTVHVYDMYWTNEWTSNLGIGVYHTGVELHNKEYAYGGHQFPFSGIFEITPKDTEELGPNFKFKESIQLGCTDMTAPEVDSIVQQLGHQYRGDQYHLLKKNCNHFTTAFVDILTGKQLPKWVNRLASIGDTLPFVERALPKEWLTPVVLQETLPQSGHGT